MEKNVKAFMEAISTSQELQEKIRTAAAAYTGEKTDEAVWNGILMKVAAEEGYDISFDDAKDYAEKMKVNQELSADEIEQVQGGALCIGPGIGLGVGSDMGGGACAVFGWGMGVW